MNVPQVAIFIFFNESISVYVIALVIINIVKNLKNTEKSNETESNRQEIDAL